MEVLISKFKNPKDLHINVDTSDLLCHPRELARDIIEEYFNKNFNLYIAGKKYETEFKTAYLVFDKK